MNQIPLISIVVIGRNEGPRLGDCFDAIQRIRFPSEKVEWIYVDSGSRDNSMQIAAEAGARVIPISEGPHSAARARNAGWKSARGTYILFLDGDTLIEPDFIEKSLPELASDNIGVVFGDLKERYPDHSIYHLVMNRDWNGEYGWTDHCGGNALIKRVVLENVNGYDEALIAGEDNEMCVRIRNRGYQILHLNIPMGLHDLNISTFKGYWKRCFRTGYAYAAVSRKFWYCTEKFWFMKSLHNGLKGLLIFLSLFLLILLINKGSWFVAVLVLIGFLTIILRTLCRELRAGIPLKTACLYSWHAHFQHVPIFFGQCFYWFDRLCRRSSDLIEYK